MRTVNNNNRTLLAQKTIGVLKASSKENIILLELEFSNLKIMLHLKHSTECRGVLDDRIDIVLTHLFISRAYDSLYQMHEEMQWNKSQ